MTDFDTVIDPRTGMPRWGVELEPVIASLLDRHIAAAQEWFPHQYVPWSQGRDYDGPLDGLAWHDAQSALAPVARSALVLSILTEDNLPSYFGDLTTGATHGAWAEWVHRWTAEEDRHSTALRAYAHTTRAVDPVALERSRMHAMSTPTATGHGRRPHGLAFTAIQELATRVAHRNTARHCGDVVCAELFARVASDENLHMLFYRDLFTALLDHNPDLGMCALRDVLTRFAMPGRTIPGFAALSTQIADAGWYDLRIYHDHVLQPLVRVWGITDRAGLTGSGERARDDIHSALATIDAQAHRFEERRAHRRATSPLSAS